MQVEAEAHRAWRGPKTNQLLTVALVLLALLVVRPADFGASSADAAPASNRKTGASPFNSGAQREKMISAMRSVEVRLERIERKLNAGIEVRVTEMPSVRIAE